jgi:hypothetical protein
MGSDRFPGFFLLPEVFKENATDLHTISKLNIFEHQKSVIARKPVWKPS